MHTRCTAPRYMLVLLLVGCIAAGPLFGDQGEYQLSEHLGYSWTAQLISFPVSFAAGACREIVRVTSDGQPVAFQVPAAEVTRHPEGTLATARVYVITDLAAGQNLVFRAWGDHEAERAEVPGPELRVAEDDNLVTLETGPVGIRLPVGEFAGGEIPAPYQGVKLTTGRWVGGSRLMGDPGPVALNAEIAERGPLFAEVRLQYSYPEDRSYTLTCRAIAGEPVALFAEEFDVEAGRGYHRNLQYDFRRFVQGRFGYSEAFEQSHWVRLSLAGFAPDLAAISVSAHDPHGGYVGQGKHAPVAVDDPWLTTLHPWQSWHGGTPLFPLFNEQDYLGFIALRAGHWVRPLENLVLVRQENGEIYLQLPINDGRREWGMHFGPVDSPLATGEERLAREYPGLDHPSPLLMALIKHGQTSLEVVKDWELAWEDTQAVPHPISINPPGQVEVVRERIANDPLLSEHAHGVETAWENQRNTPGFPKTRLWVMTPEGVEDVYLYTGKPEHARELYTLTLDRLRYYCHETLAGVGHHGYRAGHEYGMFHLAGFLVGVARQADLALSSPHVTPEEKAALRAQLAFFAYLYTDRDYWPPNEIGKGTYNMYASRDGVVGLLSTVLAGHPEARAWAAVGEARVEDVLANFIYPSGAMIEGMHYSGVTLDFILPMLSMFKLSGGTDYFTDERLKRGLRWYASWLPPVDPRFERAYMPPFGYSHNSNTSQSVRWAVAAAMTAETDPDFSRLMMFTWRRQGSLLTMVGGEAGYRSAFSLGLVDPALPTDETPPLVSEAWEGAGAVLRNHTGHPHEFFMAVPTGTGFRAYPTEGTFHLYAKGVPLCLRFGTRTFNVIATMQAWMNNRITFDKRDECTNDRGQIIAWASLASGDLFGGEYRFTRLAARQAMQGDEPGAMELSEPRVVDTDLPVGEGLGFFGDQEDVDPQTWRRRILLVKDDEPEGPHYFLVRDSFQATLPTDWSLWCLAEDLQVEDDRATFTGKFGVDLDVFRATPTQKTVTGAWGPDWERQKLLQFHRGVNEGYFALLYPRAQGEPVPGFARLGEEGVQVTLPGRTEWVFLTEDPVRVQHGAVEFQGRAGFAQQTEVWTRITLLDGDRLALGDFVVMHGRQVVEDVRVETDGPLSVSATLAPGPALTGEWSGDPREVVIQVPPAYRGLTTLLIDGQPAALRTPAVGTYAFLAPPGHHRFELR